MAVLFIGFYVYTSPGASVSMELYHILQFWGITIV